MLCEQVLKEKYPETPIVVWGHPSRGGDQGKHFHYKLVRVY
jgi:hypothetical protein